MRFRVVGKTKQGVPGEMRNKTGTSQVSAISKAQIKSKGGTFGDKKNSKKVAQCRKKSKGDPFSPVRFCRLRLKSKRTKGGLWNNLDAFPWYLVSFS